MLTKLSATMSPIHSVGGLIVALPAARNGMAASAVFIISSYVHCSDGRVTFSLSGTTRVNILARRTVDESKW